MKDSDSSVTVKYSGVIYKFPSADIGELRDSTDYLDNFKTLPSIEEVSRFAHSIYEISRLHYAATIMQTFVLATTKSTRPV